MNYPWVNYQKASTINNATVAPAMQVKTDFDNAYSLYESLWLCQYFGESYHVNLWQPGNGQKYNQPNSWQMNELNTLNSYVVWSLWISICSGFFSFHLFLVFVLQSSILFLLHILHTEQSLPPVLQVLPYYIVLVQYNIVQWNPWDYLKTQINLSIKNLSLLAFLVSCHFHPPNSGVIKKLAQTAISLTSILMKAGCACWSTIPMQHKD